MYDYYPYWKKHKLQNKTVIHKPVIRTKIFPVRIGGDLRIKIEAKIKEPNLDFSKCTRMLWEDYFKKLEEKEWNKEVSNW